MGLVLTTMQLEIHCDKQTGLHRDMLVSSSWVNGIKGVPCYSWLHFSLGKSSFTFIWVLFCVCVCVIYVSGSGGRQNLCGQLERVSSLTVSHGLWRLHLLSHIQTYEDLQKITLKKKKSQIEGTESEFGG